MDRFENESHLERENKAITLFTSKHGLTFKKLGDNDIDFQIFRGESLIGFVEVKGRHESMANAYPLPIAIRKLNKLQGERFPRLNPIIIWACDDGIIYGYLTALEGRTKYGGRAPRKGSTNDQELMAYYEAQESLHHESY